MSKQTLLIELGCEELPAAALPAQSEALARGIFDALLDAGLVDSTTTARPLATPRRLAVLIDGVAAAQPNQTIERKGPSVQAAFDDAGQPTQAALGFANSVGLDVAKLTRLKTDQGEWLAARVEKVGQDLTTLLQEALEVVVRKMSSAKSMRWQTTDDRFLRPVRWLVVMHGSTVLPVSLFGLEAHNATHGHRVHAPGPWAIPQASDYPTVLENAFVLVDPNQRRQAIADQIHALVKENNAEFDEQTVDALITENTHLTEWPQAIMGQFDPAFLSVPEAALISAMQHHQKCFALRDTKSKALRSEFIVIANIESEDVAAMRSGFERVIRPRLADAKFFWLQDQKTPLDQRREHLDAVTFQKDLGSIGAKVSRLAETAPGLADAIGAEPERVNHSLQLSKSDLLTEMVGEFPELQGIMGAQYALAAGEEPATAQAIEQHYWPKASTDPLPRSKEAIAIGLADRADTLIGIFGVGLKPKGSKDPFALRRTAMGLVRLLEHQPTLELAELLKMALTPIARQLSWDEAHQQETLADVHSFCLDRWRSYALDQGISTATANAALAVPVSSISDLSARANAISGLLSHPAIERLVAANKRLANLLGQTHHGEDVGVDEARLVETQEKTLFAQWRDKQTRIDQAIGERNYDQAMGELVELADPLDAFFEHVMVMSDDALLQTNRLALLREMRAAFLRIGDLAQLGV